MATATYNFDVAAEYTLSGTQITTAATLATGQTTGTIRCDLFFKSYTLNSFTPTAVLNGGTILYGLEIDTVLKYWDGAAWSASDGSAPQLSTLADVQANLASAVNSALSVVKPFARLSRSLISDPSPELDVLVVEHLSQIPNKQVMLASDPALAYNTGVGGVPTPGQTRATLDPAQVQYNVGEGDLFVFLNGQLINAYIEEDATHVVFTVAIDNTGPTIDELEFRTATQGSSQFIEPPTFLVLAPLPERPDNFGGLFSFV